MPEIQGEIKKEPRRWFRFYAESINDPKVQRLPAHLFKTWVNLLALACAHGGELPPVHDIAFQLRMSDLEAQTQVDELIGLGLLDITADKKLEPHNWASRQFLSDTSKDRVRKHRAKKAEASPQPEGNVTVTPPEADSETEPETDQRSADTPREVAAALPSVDDLKTLSDRLYEVAGSCLASQAIAPGLASMMIPQMWLDQGCDLERDIIPTLETFVARGKRNVANWAYFTNAVAETRAKRLAGLPTINLSPQPLQRKRLDLSKLNIVDSPPEAYAQ